MTITINPVSDPPVAVNDAYGVEPEQTLTVSAPGVLGNDTDPDAGTTLSAVLVAGPSHGTLTLNANGSFSYTPNTGYVGLDSFTYKANDGTADSNVATVTLDLSGLGYNPLLVAGSPSAAHEDETVTAAELRPIVLEAARRWGLATGDPQLAARFSAIEIHIADLAGAYLGLEAGGVIWIDKNAAGHGWFIDATPGDDAEFVAVGLYASAALPGTVAAERVDLLSVVIHEMGHALGFAHSDEGVMQETLALGVRHPFGCGCAACAGAVNFVEAGSPVLLSESATSAALPAVLVGGFGELFAPDPRYWEVPTSPAPSSAALIYPLYDSAIAGLFPILSDDYLLADDAVADGGDDVLIGGAGDSILVGGAGRDVLIGGF